jgi:hypothetical protein
MSAYKIVVIDITEIDYVIEGLLAIGIPAEMIEIHDIPQSLVGYEGSKRGQKANVIVRRANVNKLLSGGASNDIGFEKKDGKITVHVSDYDQKWWRKKSETFLQHAACAKYEAEAKKLGRGYRVEKKIDGKNIKLKLIKAF